MNPTIKIDASQWKKAARELFQTSSRSCVDFTNGQALKVAIEAIRRTKKTPAAQIRAELNPLFVKRILLKRFKKTGQWGKKIDESMPLAKRIKTEIGKRVRSAAFIASGWIPARRKLFAVVKQKPAGLGMSFSGARQFGRDKGAARPAMSSGITSKILAEIQNTALLSKSEFPSKEHDPMPVAVAGLQAALDEATRDMIQTLARRLNKDLNKFTRK